MKFVCFAALFYLSFCNAEHTKLANTMLQEVHDVSSKEINFILIIPREGCTGCINYATGFTLANLHRLRNTKVIFTNISDRKALKNILGNSYLDKNIYIDSANKFYLPQSENAIYPQLVTINNGNESISVYKAEDSVILLK